MAFLTSALVKKDSLPFLAITLSAENPYDKNKMCSDAICLPVILTGHEEIFGFPNTLHPVFCTSKPCHSGNPCRLGSRSLTHKMSSLMIEP
jgi:hypothetical protein